MYKYTNLLSESYRSTNPTQHNNKQHQQSQQTTTYIQPRTSSDCYCKPLHPSARTVNVKSHKMQAINLTNQYLANLYEKAKRRSISSVQDQQMSVSERIQRLSDLGDRHQQALREVELQSKLKEITNKYARQQRPYTAQYFQSKQPFAINKQPSPLNKIPEYAKFNHRQNHSPLHSNYNHNQPTNQPKYDRKQQHGRNLQQNRITNETSQVKGYPLSERVEAVSKLASLQERIRQSIDKLH